MCTLLLVLSSVCFYYRDSSELSWGVQKITTHLLCSVCSELIGSQMHIVISICRRFMVLSNREAFVTANFNDMVKPL